MLDSEFELTLSAAQSGAEWAWTQLYHSVARQVLGYLRAQSAREPEDLLCAVFVHIARGIGSFEGTEAGFRSWAFTVAPTESSTSGGRDGDIRLTQLRR